MSPLLNSVVDAINLGTQAKANPWKIKISDFFDNVEKARDLFSKIVNAKRDTIALIPIAELLIAKEAPKAVAAKIDPQ